MLTKEQHIGHWQKQADFDWETMQVLFANRPFLHGLFWVHLVAEKLAKALWIRDNESNAPPKTHNIAVLISKTGLNPSIEMTELMLFANRFNLEGRYPELMEDLRAVNNPAFAGESLERIKILIEWLRENLR